MILELSGYNPLPAILMFPKLTNPDVETLEAIRDELFRAGVIPETGEEFVKVLDLILETEKVFYGKK